MIIYINLFIKSPNHTAIIPKKMLYTIWQQIKNHTFKGNYKATFGMFQAMADVVVNIPNFIKNIYSRSNKSNYLFQNFAMKVAKQ